MTPTLFSSLDWLAYDSVLALIVEMIALCALVEGWMELRRDRDG